MGWQVKPSQEILKNESFAFIYRTGSRPSRNTKKFATNGKGRNRMKRLIIVILIGLSTGPVIAADYVLRPLIDDVNGVQTSQPRRFPVLKGRTVVMDGRTLWFPSLTQRVRLHGIDVCELSQWSFDPHWARETQQAPTPVPCGAHAKAWLKRMIGSSDVTCKVLSYDSDLTPQALCSIGKRDLALEMLRVGWARTVSTDIPSGQYLDYQYKAMSARYGMWATYVLNMNEWRKRAVDKTINRQPIADFNLLVQRRSEISPPFFDARRKPKTTYR